MGINVYLWNASSLAGNAMPMPFGFGMAVVLSGSMEPVLSVNDLLLSLIHISCVISGTFAKYTTQAGGSDTARVAKWGVEVSSTGMLFRCV